MSEGGKTHSIWTISNVITITRILLVPAFVAALLCPWPEWFNIPQMGEGVRRVTAAVIFVLISCTDWLDGYLARRLGQVTDFGKFMDPLADKILVAAALIALVELGSLPTWVVLIILAREFIVSGVRMMAATQGIVIAASWLGKFKTVFQMIAIVLFTLKVSSFVDGLDPAIDHALYVFSWVIMIIALGLTIASMIDYLVKAKEVIGLGETRKLATKGSLDAAARTAVEMALERGVTVAAAESLTGGLIGSSMCSVPGASAAYLGGAVTYVNPVKEKLLGVDAQVLETDGAVSESCACQMADGMRNAVGCDIAVSATGVAGPTGAEPGKPVGTVWIGVASVRGNRAVEHHFEGDRASVREQAAKAALDLMVEEIESC